jgi:N-acetylglucosaminyldiphosphoundecaprenol N-acetyl-beta-D-mannosaminyltransferase
MKSKNIKTVALFGLPISNVTMAEAVERIAEGIEAGTSQQIATANMDFARNARSNSFLHQVMCDCSMVLPDGAPMLWASRLLGNPLKERVTGVDLIPQLAKLSAERGYRIYFLGSEEKNSSAAAAVLEARFPGCKIVGRHSPEVMPLDEMNDDDILNRIRAAKPDILLVAFGNPKQELWIDRNRHRLNVPVAIGIGGSLDMIAGSLKRAPRWIQMLQMEWMYRMLQEPRRLLPRYARDFMALMRHLPVEVAAVWMQPEKKNDWPLEVSVENGTRVLHMPAVLTGDECSEVLNHVQSAAVLGESVIFDMVLTERVEADGVGCLLEARRTMNAAGLPFWLASVAGPVRRVLQSAALVQHIRMASTTPEALKLSHQPERRKRFVPVTGLNRLAAVSRKRLAA